MRISQLKQVVVIAKHGSINKASQELDISQPALSAALRELENELGLAIFWRTRKGVILTPQGKRLLEEAKRILESVDRINALSETVDTHTEIKIGTGAFFESLIPSIVTMHQKSHPQTLLSFLPFEDLNDIIKEHYRICLSCFSEEELIFLQ